MKLIDILHDASNNLLRNKSRTFLTVIAIFIGAMTLTITNGIGLGVSSYIDQQVGSVGAKDVLIIQAKAEHSPGAKPQKYDPNRGPSIRGGGYGPSMPQLHEKDIDVIKSIPGIVTAAPSITITPDYIEGNNNQKYQINVVQYISGTNLALSAGTLTDNTSSRNEIILTPGYADVLGFSNDTDAIGKTVRIGISSANGKQSEVRATIVGIMQQTLVSISGANINQPLITALHDLQIIGRPPAIKEDYLVVLGRVKTGISDVQLKQIKSDLDKKGYTAQTIEDRIGLFKNVIDAVILVLNVFASIALIAASFGIVNTLLMAVQERTKEIGLMKAMGLGKNKIFLLFSLEAILLGFWGSLFGSAAGIGIGLVANRIATKTFLKDLPGFNLTSFTIQSVLSIMLIIMTIAFLAGTLPARRAAKKDPIEALRYE